jgi:DNA-binding transcriptional LysR family regulator
MFLDRACLQLPHAFVQHGIMPRETLAWEDLRIVLAVARAGNLRRAAGQLALDATTVGRRLSAIDARVGYALFERTGALLALTPAARALVADLEAMEAAALAAERKLAGSAKPATGTVKVATSDAFSMYFLAEQLRALADELPGIEVELVTSHALADLRRREADIALRFVKPDSPDLLARRVSSLRWSLYASASYLAGRPRVDPQRGLAGHRVLRWTGPPLRPAVVAWVDAHTQAAERALASSSLHVLIEACVRGVGLAVLPGAMALARGLVRTIDHAIDEGDLWLIVHRDLRKVPRVRAVSTWLWARLRAHAETIRAI